MENRLCLNKKPVYELPGDVMIGQYTRRNKKEDVVPNFEPDICISAFGTIGIRKAKQTVTQIWVKSNNKELIEFIRNFRFLNVIKKSWYNISNVNQSV